MSVSAPFIILGIGYTRGHMGQGSLLENRETSHPKQAHLHHYYRFDTPRASDISPTLKVYKDKQNFISRIKLRTRKLQMPIFKRCLYSYTLQMGTNIPYRFSYVVNL